MAIHDFRQRMRINIVLHLAFIFLMLGFTPGLYAGYFPVNDSAGNADTVSRKQEILQKMDELTDFYGSLRFKVGIDYNGESGIQDNASCMGIKGAIPMVKGVDAIMQLEVGIGLVGNKTTIKFSGDPGGAYGEIDNVFTSRLGYVGIRY